jgi:L-alanine-DL-glutamate epimerase-like enolase superfamily enzyme
MRCTVGSNLELGLGIAASLHFAASTPSVNTASDFTCGAYLHDRDITSCSIVSTISSGCAPVDSATGLGVELESHWEEIA